MGRIILLSGMPGSGKSTLARALCGGGQAVHLRVDTIEKAIRESDLAPPSAIDAGYRAAAAQAEELTALGHDVVCDAVNASAAGRALWPEPDLTVHVSIPEELRAQRIDERGFAGYPHVWEDWQVPVLKLDGRSDPEEMAQAVRAALPQK
ncbi:AAA family ATPase [Roseobacter sp. S98]|uniref:AAA family ATPase n=1 Tax=Roseobacter algicola (ex Choi et al. 2025) (nom. illeg.) TaxID=3092138 RepID=UPI003F515796